MDQPEQLVILGRQVLPGPTEAQELIVGMQMETE
jgi:hypothetical protein